jgi:hypothetical protein
LEEDKRTYSGMPPDVMTLDELKAEEVELEKLKGEFGQHPSSVFIE